MNLTLTLLYDAVVCTCKIFKMVKSQRTQEQTFTMTIMEKANIGVKMIGRSKKMQCFIILYRIKRQFTSNVFLYMYMSSLHDRYILNSPWFEWYSWGVNHWHGLYHHQSNKSEGIHHKFRCPSPFFYFNSRAENCITFRNLPYAWIHIQWYVSTHC